MNEKPKIVGNKYQIEKRLGNGSFGSIYQGFNIRTREKIAIKIESNQSDIKSLKNEVRIYQYLNGYVKIPSLRWFGSDESSNYMVIDLLGPSLTEVVRKRGKFSLHTVLKIGIQMIDILQGIHEKGMVHRDIKPDNFLIHSISEFDQIFIIDFGLCKTYVNQDTNEHIDMRKSKSFIGTPNFASVNSHQCLELSRRDDLESLGYTLLFLYFGELPWNSKIITSREEIFFSKKELLINENSDFPKIIIQFLSLVQRLDFKEQPLYQEYKNMFHKWI